MDTYSGALQILSRMNARRSLVAACNIPQGTVVTAEMITYKRPGSGISASEFEDVVGKVTCTSIEEDTILQWKMFSEL